MIIQKVISKIYDKVNPQTVTDNIGAVSSESVPDNVLVDSVGNYLVDGSGEYLTSGD